MVVKFYRQTLWPKSENFQNVCELQNKHFLLGRINRENSYRTFSVNLGGRELPKCV